MLEKEKDIERKETVREEEGEGEIKTGIICVREERGRDDDFMWTGQN